MTDMNNLEYDELPSDVYWHAPYDLPSGERIRATRIGNDQRVRKRADILRGLVRITLGSLHGKTVLDLGCADGYFSRVALSLGAAHVLGVDINPTEIKKARWVSRQFGDNNTRFEVADITSDSLPTTDVVLCLGLLYHLGNPVGFFKRLSEITRELLIVDTDVLPLDGPFARLEMEGELPWKHSQLQAVWVPTPTTLSIMAYCAGFIRETNARIHRSAPVDYRARRRILIAFHKDRPQLGHISQYQRPKYSEIDSPFSKSYRIGTIAYHATNFLLGLLDKLTRKW